MEVGVHSSPGSHRLYGMYIHAYLHTMADHPNLANGPINLTTYYVVCRYVMRRWKDGGRMDTSQLRNKGIITSR